MILAIVREGFVAELTYGEDVNWYRNAAAAGQCVVVSRGREYQVSAIEPYDSQSGRHAYPAPFRHVLEFTGRNDSAFFASKIRPTLRSDDFQSCLEAPKRSFALPQPAERMDQP